MSANVEPEEVEAVLDGVVDASHDAAQVTSRDFRRPQRLSATRLSALEEDLAKPVADLPQAVQEACGVSLSLRLASIGEVSADGLFEGVGEEATILRFKADGIQAWLLWDAAEAAALAETLLGASDAKAVARALTPLEERLVAEPLITVTAVLAQALGIKVDDFYFAKDATDVGNWRDVPGTDDAHPPDPYRLQIELDITRASGESSTAHIYLPVEQEIASRAVAIDLPEHLAPVSVEVVAQLAQAEITLAQLLQLEVGDVIQTDARIDTTALLLVEDRPFAEAYLGIHRGRFAVRIAPASVARGESK